MLKGVMILNNVDGFGAKPPSRITRTDFGNTTFVHKLIGLSDFFFNYCTMNFSKYERVIEKRVLKSMHFRSRI